MPVAVQTETADSWGMPRPEAVAFYLDGALKWAQPSYAYDGSGNVRSFALWEEGDTQAISRSFTYDGLNRLADFYDGGNLDRSYAYDAYGNLTTYGDTAMVPDVATNRFTSINGSSTPLHVSYGYWDIRGNLLKIPAFSADQRAKEFAFSDEDRLMESVDVDSSSIWRYAYDTSSERVVSWLTDGAGSAQEARITIRGESGAVLTDWLWIGGGTPTFSRSRDYLYAGGRMATQIDWGVTATRRYAAVDHLGSTRYLAALDDSGNLVSEEFLEYYPFGNFRYDVAPPDPDTTHLFTGHERDLGLHLNELDYMHARYYSPNLGRFVSVDPVGGTVGSSQGWNRYAYASNNPVRMIDPNGMEEIDANLAEFYAVAFGRPVQDIQSVDVHGGFLANTAASIMGVPAFTVYNNVYLSSFDANLYEDLTVGAIGLLGHEIAHTFQYAEDSGFLSKYFQEGAIAAANGASTVPAIHAAIPYEKIANAFGSAAFHLAIDPRNKNLMDALRAGESMTLEQVRSIQEQLEEAINNGELDSHLRVIDGALVYVED